MIVFIELPIFSRCANTLFSDEDIAELQGTLLENPAAGPLISGGRGQGQWDTAVVLEVAGGAVTDLRGAPLRYGLDRPILNPEFLASGCADQRGNCSC